MSPEAQATHINVLAADIAADIINSELAGTDPVYDGLTSNQKAWVSKVAGPLFVVEALATAEEIERVRLASPKVKEQQLVVEVETYLQNGRVFDDLIEGE